MWNKIGAVGVALCLCFQLVGAADNIEMKRLELEAMDKAVAYEKDHPGEANPYREYAATLKQSPEVPAPHLKSFLARNWWWLFGGAAVALAVTYAVGYDDGKKVQLERDLN